MGSPKHRANDGIGNATPKETVGALGLFGAMLVFFGLMPLGFAAFLLFDLAKGLFDPEHVFMQIRLEGTLVTPQYAIFVFLMIALLPIVFGSVFLWLASTNFLFRSPDASAKNKSAPRM